MAKSTTNEKKDKPQKRGFFRGMLNTFFDVPRWVNAQQYIDTNKTLFSKIKDSFRITKAERTETFEAAMQRLKLNEHDLKERIASNQRALIIMLIFVGVMCLYTIYLMFVGAIAGVLVGLAVIMLSSVRAFQYSFWNFQMKNKTLGCSFSTWLKRKKFL